MHTYINKMYHKICVSFVCSPDLCPFKGFIQNVDHPQLFRVHALIINLNITHPQTDTFSSGCGGSPHVGRDSLVTRKRDCYRAVTECKKGLLRVCFLFFHRQSEMYRKKRLSEHTGDSSNLTPLSPTALYFTLVVCWKVTLSR